MKALDYIPLSEFPENTYVLLDQKGRKLLFNKLEKIYGFLTRARAGITTGDIYYWKRGFEVKGGKRVNRYIPLPRLKLLCKKAKIELNSLQQYVTEIKTSSRSGVIKKPKLPLPIIPETFAVLGHMISDGYGGERGNACYVNTKQEALDNFVKKLTRAFGDVEYHIMPQHNRVIIAKIVPRILKNYFGVDDFRSSGFKITEKIYTAPRAYLAEFVKAVIIDEGRIADSGIYVEFSANPAATQAIRKICEEGLGYSCYSSGRCVIISAKSFPLILKDMRDFVIMEKQQMFLKWFSRGSRGWYNKKEGQTKEGIVRLLLERPMPVKELALKLNVKSESVRTQIRGYSKEGRSVSGLLDMGLVEKITTSSRDTAIYGIRDKERAVAYAK